MTASEPGSSAASTASPGTLSSADSESQEDTCGLCGGIGFVRRALPLGDPEFGRKTPCQCVLGEDRDQRTARLQRYSSLGPLARARFDTLHARGRSAQARDQDQFEALFNDATKFAEDPLGWIFILGPSGSGKTHVSAAIANRCIERGQPALFVVVPELLDRLRSSFNPGNEVNYDESLDQVQNAPVLILDDLGTENATSWAQEKLFQIVNHRYNSRLPTVITTNLSVDRLESRLRMRLTDPELAAVYKLETDASAIKLVFDDSLSLPRIREMTFENFELNLHYLSSDQRESLERAYRSAMNFADSPRDWLTIVGRTASGKTHLAAAIANRSEAHGLRPIFLTSADFLDYIRHLMNEQESVSFLSGFRQLRDAPLLILDDLVVTRDTTSWVRERFFQLINHRLGARLPTVFTINREVLGNTHERILSRLYDTHVSTVVEISAPPYLMDDLDADAGPTSHAGRPQSSRTQGRSTGSGQAAPRPFRAPPGRAPHGR
jgi:DNA replication protein DnaC